jgi:hypothetical protein
MAQVEKRDECVFKNARALAGFAQTFVSDSKKDCCASANRPPCLLTHILMFGVKFHLSSSSS